MAHPMVLAMDIVLVPMKVPFSDLVISEEEKQAVRAVLDSNWPSGGDICDEFEAQLGKYLNSNVAVVNTGSSALMVSLLVNGVKAGDTVLVPDFTYIATASVPAILGCKIAPVDADLETFNMDNRKGLKAFGDKWADYITPHIISTDVAGLPDDLVAHHIVLVEDGAEALGAERRGQRIGAESHLTTFSFQATKQLSTIEGGAIASRDEELIEKCRTVAAYGSGQEPGKGLGRVHTMLGMNFRMSDLTATLGLVQLRNLDNRLRRRAEVAGRYSKELSSLLRPQATPSYVSRHAWWTFLAMVKDGKRDSLLKKLNDAGVDAREPWRPIHLQPCFNIDGEYPYPNSMNIWRQGILLPIYNEMSEDAVDYVVSTALA